MRSKVNVANGSNESAQGLLKTGSAVRDPDVTVQSESAACEVDPSKYYLSMKPHSSHANQDAYEIHVWVRNCQYFVIVLQSYAPAVCIALVKCIVFEASPVVLLFSRVSWSRPLTVPALSRLIQLGNTLQSQGALIKTHHDCLNLQAKLSERYVISISMPKNVALPGCSRRRLRRRSQNRVL